MDASPMTKGDEEQQSATRSRLVEAYRQVRRASEVLAAPIPPEDAQIQSMPDVSPTKWHLAHTSWFFETFLLERDARHVPFHEEFKILFNSYYNGVGRQHPRPRRGMLGRPRLEEVMAYRHGVDAAMHRLLETGADAAIEPLGDILRVGLHHEQQHQELLLTDILHVYWSNPLRPAYRDGTPPTGRAAPPLSWCGHPEGIYWIGHPGAGFGFDNEYPRHRQFVHAFELASRPATAGEYMQFVADEGYRRPELWLSEGWASVEAEGWGAPLYWEERDGAWWHMTLYGMQPVDPVAPVCHVSYYEADAFSRWSGARLPTEAEWEVAAEALPIDGNLRETGLLTPVAAAGDTAATEPRQMYGDVWEWTGSAYLPYPGYRAGAGALGEYNGKFMCNQMVLRGGSCATPRNHIRASYRNFFPPPARWQFSGVRLARDA